MRCHHGFRLAAGRRYAEVRLAHGLLLGGCVSYLRFLAGLLGRLAAVSALGAGFAIAAITVA